MIRVVLISLLFLVGCTNEPTTNEPDEPEIIFDVSIAHTFLKCDSESGATIWIVLDHVENTWISSSDRNGDSSTENFFLNTYGLIVTPDTYGFRANDNRIYRLDRRSLVYNSYTKFQCAITDELNELLSIGLEKRRIKI